MSVPGSSSQPLVSFFFVGPGKTGTSWLYDFLRRRGVASAPSLKEPYLIDKDPSEQARLVSALYDSVERMCDFSNTYSDDPENPAKIVRYNPEARVIITCRKPSERIVSHYGFEVRSGAEDIGLAAYLDAGDAVGMVRRSDYRTILHRYLAVLPRERVLVLPLEQLAHEPETYVRRLTDFLGVEPVAVTEEDFVPVRVRAKPRSRALARTAARGGQWLRRRGLARTLGALKRSRVIAKLLYHTDGAPPSGLDLGSMTARVQQLDDDYPAFVEDYADTTLGRAR